jgi:GABA permease
VSDEDAARRRAKERVTAFVERLRQQGVHAEGRVGDANPLQAIADALTTFPADEIAIVASPERPSRFVDGLVARARNRFALPVSSPASVTRSQRSRLETRTPVVCE